MKNNIWKGNMGEKIVVIGGAENVDRKLKEQMKTNIIYK
jgi:hypothetical protein